MSMKIRKSFLKKKIMNCCLFSIIRLLIKSGLFYKTVELTVVISF